MKTTPPEHSLSELLAGLADVSSLDDRIIAGLVLDSRAAGPGDVFVALAGTKAHGLDFSAAAVEAGAVAIIYEPVDGLVLPELDVPMIAIDNLGQALGGIASRFHGKPGARLEVIGVTGTNGKTTCVSLLAQALPALGRRTAMIGTTGSGEWGGVEASSHTTPDAISLQKRLAGFESDGIEAVAMEVSSHALEQGRVNGTAFDVAVFTNLSREHLDYHGSMQVYAGAKTRLFHDWPLRLAVINADDALGMELLRSGVNAGKVSSYGLSAGDVHAERLELRADGLSMRVVCPDGGFNIDSPLYGRFNAANLLACAAVLTGCGWEPARVGEALSAAQPAPGRMERFAGPRCTIVVDYAHTPDALEQALAALREHLAGRRLWCVFGCGGERDPGKRPLMGAVAARLADEVVVTDDNPRHEDATQIRQQVLAGMQGAGHVREIGDRRVAIETACREAGAGDIVLLAGKGHETTQQVGDLRLPFSDRDLARQLAGLETS